MRLFKQGLFHKFLQAEELWRSAKSRKVLGCPGRKNTGTHRRFDKASAQAQEMKEGALRVL